MPFHGFNRCGRCRKMGRTLREYTPLTLEIVINKKFPQDKKLKVTCSYGHTWYSRSKSASRYIWQSEIVPPRTGQEGKVKDERKDKARKSGKGCRVS